MEAFDMKMMKKITLIIAIVSLIALLLVTAIAAATVLSDGNTVEHGEKYEFAQASVSGKVNLKFYYSTLGSAEYMAAEVVDPATGNVDNEYTFEISALKKVTIPASVTGSKDMECYCVTVPVAPSQMTHTVRVYACSESGKGEALEYSVAEYCGDVLADENLEGYYNSMRALLNWGAMAQKVFGDAEADLANDGLYAINTNPINGVSSIGYTEGEVTDSEHIKGDKLTLSIDPDDIVFHFYVTYTGDGTISATVSRNGSNERNATVEDLGNGSYRVNITNVGVAVFDSAYTVKVSDGEETFTVTKSVMEYLSKLASDAEYGEVAKSMYQLYTVAMNKTNANCQHQFAHRLSADENSSYAQCSLCFEVMGGAVSNNIDKYMPAEQLVDRKSMNGTVTLTQETDTDGTTFVRLSNMIVNENGWASWNPIIESGSGNYASGRYLIMKIRVNENGLGQTYHKLYVSSTISGLKDETQGVAFKATEDGQWHISVIDLAARVGNAKGSDFIANNDGTYSIKYLQFRPFNAHQKTEGVENATMDIAYIALCDNLSDIGSLVSETNYEWSTGDTSCVLRNSATNVCVAHPGTKTEESATSNVYSCTLCDHEFGRETFPESTNKYLGAGYIGTRPGGGTFNITDSGLINENGTLYHRFNGKGQTGQILWTRIGGNSSGSWPAAQINPVDVGKAKYLVLKMRGNINISSIALTIGTINGEATYENRENMKSGDIKLPQSNLKTDEWTYFVLDFEKHWSDKWVANNDGNYDVVYLQFTFYSSDSANFSTDSYVDLSYMAFVDSWAEVGALTGQETVDLVNVTNNSIKVDADTGDCVTHAVTETVSGQTYTYKCSVCGNTLGTKTISADVNWYAPLAGMSNYNSNCTKTLQYDSAADLAYVSYAGSGATHLNITGGGGAGSATAGSYDTGKYLVMMYRGSMSAGTMTMKVSSNGVVHGTLAENIGVRGGTALPSNWTVAVLDLSAQTNYICNSTGQIYIMLNPSTAYSFDVAYFAIVDDLSEILSEGDAYVDYGKSFANAGTAKEFGASNKASEDFQLSAQDIANAANTNGYALGSVEVKNDERFDYVRIYNNSTGTVNGHWAHSYAGANGTSGRYLIFKYRTNVTSGWMQFTTSPNALSGSYFSSSAQRSWCVPIGDGQWHTIVVDMAQSVSDDSAVYFTDTSAAQFVGFRPFYDSAASNANAYIDFAYVDWAITIDEVVEKVSEETDVVAGYYKSGKWNNITLE